MPDYATFIAVKPKRTMQDVTKCLHPGCPGFLCALDDLRLELISLKEPKRKGERCIGEGEIEVTFYFEITELTCKLSGRRAFIGRRLI